MAWRIGVDSGGTFTDVCLFDDASGRIEIWKVPSTPDDPSRAIADGIEQGLARARGPHLHRSAISAMAPRLPPTR
jgi:N-methylhydantoinase A